MYHSRTSKRKQRKSPRISDHKMLGLSRRLRLEPMESRLMLSATAPELPAIDWQAIPVGTEIAAFAPASGRGIWVGTVTEGGFISGDYSLVGQVEGTDTVKLQDANGVDLSIQELFAQGAFHTDSTGTGWLYFNALGTNGMVPRMIIVADADGGLGSLIQPILSEQPTIGTQNEGGSIPLESILPSFGSGVGAKFGESSLAMLTTKTPEAEGPSQSSSIAKAASVAGELARAAVFEIAGEEPNIHSSGGEDNASRTTPRGTSAQRAAEPFSATNTAEAATQFAARNSRARAGAAQTHAEAVEQISIEPNSHSARPKDDIDSSDAQSSNAHRINERRTVSVATLKSKTALSDEHVNSMELQQAAALDVAFDQFGATDEALLPRMPEARRFEGFWGTIPLLLMFTLERIATRNSRRSRLADVAVASRQPRLPR